MASSSLPSIKLGVYFGSFDPWHVNHMQLVKNLLDMGYEYVYIIPNQNNHMKPYIVSLDHRLAMINLAIVELKLEGRVVAYHSQIEQYTWEGRNKISSEIAKIYTKNMVEIYQIIGQDSFEKAITRCQPPNGIYAMNGRGLLVYPRLGYEGEVKVPDSLTNIVQIMDYKDPIKCSSTDIRDGLKKLDNHPDMIKIKPCIHKDVLTYMRNNNLYRSIESTGKVICFLGPPGSGKGSLCESLKRIYSKYTHISTGDLYRDDERKKTPEYMKIAEAKKIGTTQWNDALNEYIISKLKSIIKPDKCYLLDGLKPTDLFAFEQNIAKVDGIIVLECRHGVSFGRLKKRQSIEHRSDDTDDKIRHRLKNYYKYLFIQQEIIKSYNSTGRNVYYLDATKPTHLNIRSPIWKSLMIV